MILGNYSRVLVAFCATIPLFLGNLLMAYGSDITETPGVSGLRATTISTNILLCWPSDPREHFVVLWRSNANYQAKWIVLTNQMRAEQSGNQTEFIDCGGLMRPHDDAATNFLGLYRVYVIPDFWFNMHGVTLCGGPKIPSEDFLPFYYDGGDLFSPLQQVGLAVDGEEAGWGSIHVERVNFGTMQSPRWHQVWGFWFEIDLLSNGEHTLQLRSTLPLNNSLGPWTQDMLLSNEPVHIFISVNGERTNHLSWWDQRLGHDFRIPKSADEYANKFLKDEQSVPQIKIPLRPLGFDSKEQISTNSEMIIDLGNVSHHIKVTPEYSNALVAAVLPFVSEAARRLNLPIRTPVTRVDIARIHVQPFREPCVSILLKNGWAFEYLFGYIDMIANLHGYSSLQDPRQIPHYYSKVRMTKSQAIQFARDALNRLGIPLQDVFAEQEPEVVGPLKIGTNTVPDYEIKWYDPRGGGCSADIHINGNTRQIERLQLFNKFLGRSQTKLNVTPISAPDWPAVNPEYARQLIPLMFKAIDDYAKKLSLPIPQLLTTNNVARIEIHDNEGWPHAEITLTNGWRFIYRHTMVNGFYAPDNLFASEDRKIRINEFEGKWNLTTNQAIEVVRRAMGKLDYPTNNVHMDFAPNVYTAAVDSANIPRLRFEWYYSIHDELQSRLEAEVNADNGKLESLYYDDKAYWNSRPRIDVPISSGKYPNLP